jgi:apolipoprotein N-acyltransferase
MNKSSLYWGFLAGIFSATLWVLSIPPFDFPEAAYIAFVPLLLWVCGRPSPKVFWIVAIGTGWLSWFAILVWLRHVTWFGTFALSGVLALFFALWLFVARLLLPDLGGRAFWCRAVVFFGLAGLWVVLEWSRTWVLWGFPWAPLSLSQWERPVVLQIAAWSGAYGVSFLLVLFNLCVAQTFWQRFRVKERKMWMGWFSPDLYLGMVGLGVVIYVFFASLPPPDSTQKLFTAAVVQPYIPPNLKWETDRELENLQILERQTRFVASLESDLILWPEAATPWPIIGTPEMQLRVERLVDELGKPILMGNLADDSKTGAWANGVFLVEPGSGLAPDYYAKRELVPFGEFVPPPFGFIKKVVPVGGDFQPGDSVALIDLKVGGDVGANTFRIGALVCYEDVFPHLARKSAGAGADIFFVATNNAWYGEEGGAEQHAAHSVLRAVENRRPVMRAGNGGWSGWIDSHGTVREVLRDAEGSVYFRGGGTLDVFCYESWARRQSFYTRHGDWFVGLAAAFSLIGFAVGRRLSGLRR